MSGVMLKTAIYGMLRVTFDLLGAQLWWWGLALLRSAWPRALFGVLFAAVQNDMKRLLAYSSIENIGIIFTGIGLAMVFHGVRHAAAGGARAGRARSITASITRCSRACCSSAPAPSCMRPASATSASSAG